MLIQLIQDVDTNVSCSVLCRIDLAKPDQPNQIELGRKDESKVHRLFLDPTGEKKTQHFSRIPDSPLKTLPIGQKLLISILFILIQLPASLLSRAVKSF